jgi:hypothetical protein
LQLSLWPGPSPQLLVEVFFNSMYPAPLQHMWLLCPRRHVVGGPLSIPQRHYVAGCLLPKPRILQASRQPAFPFWAHVLPTPKCTPETELSSSRFPILVLSRSGPYPSPRPSLPLHSRHIVSLRSTMHSCIRIPPWPSTSAPPAPCYSAAANTSYIPVPSLGRLYLAFSIRPPVNASSYPYPRLKPRRPPALSASGAN